MCRTYAQVRLEEQGSVEHCRRKNLVALTIILSALVVVVTVIALSCGFLKLDIAFRHNGTNSNSSVVGSKDDGSGLSKSPRHNVGRTNGVQEINASVRMPSEPEMIRYLDQSTDPCEDFYTFACGAFAKQPIPRNVDSVSSWAAMRDKVEAQLLQELSQSHPDEPHSFTVLKNFFKACTNKASIEAHGLKSLRNIINSLGRWPLVEGSKWDRRNFSWIKAMYLLNDAGFENNFFLQLSFYFDSRGNIVRRNITSSEYVIYPELLTPHYTSEPGPDTTKIKDSIVKIAVRLGADQYLADEQLDEAMHFEQSLKNYTQSETTSTSLANLTEQFPSIPWEAYFRRMLSRNIEKNQYIVIDNAALSHFVQVMSKASKEVQANYLMYSIVKYIGPFIASNFAAMEDTDPTKFCSSLVSEILSPSLTALYVRKFFLNSSQQHRAAELTEELKAQYRILLVNTNWMDEFSRKASIRKLENMRSQMGCRGEIVDPAKLEDFHRSVVVDERYFFQSYLNITRGRRNFFIAKLGALVDETYYGFSAVSEPFNAYNYFEENKIVISFGMIVASLDTNDNAPQYHNYGKLGWIIGHEIAHGFDGIGSHFDEHGRYLEHFWTPSTRNDSNQKTKCMVDQFSDYTVKAVERQVNGTLTVDENLADSAGVKPELQVCRTARISYFGSALPVPIAQL